MGIRKKISPFILIAMSLAITMNYRADDAQPIIYSHKKHVGELSIGCSDCHSNADKQARALIPNIEVCGACHLETEVDHPEERKVAAYVTEGVMIPWRQVHAVPDYVYFSHRRHVTLGGLECAVCHGQVEQMEQPFTRPSVSMDMTWCTGCHQGAGVTNDCAACHR